MVRRLIITLGILMAVLAACGQRNEPATSDRALATLAALPQETRERAMAETIAALPPLTKTALMATVFEKVNDGLNP